MQGAAALKVLARSWMSGYLMRMRALHTHAGWRSMKGMVRQITVTVLEVSVPPFTAAHERLHSSLVASAHAATNAVLQLISHSRHRCHAADLCALRKSHSQ
jgi:hypothetical protein